MQAPRECARPGGVRNPPEGICITWGIICKLPMVFQKAPIVCPLPSFCGFVFCMATHTARMVPIRYMPDIHKHKTPGLWLTTLEVDFAPVDETAQDVPSVVLYEYRSIEEPPRELGLLPVFVGPHASLEASRPKLERYWGLGMDDDERLEVREITGCPIVRALVLHGHH